MIYKISKVIKTITTLRHPARVMLSHLKRHTEEERILLHAKRMAWQFQEIENLNAFRFPIEVMPWDALEAFIGREVIRVDEPIKSVGDYPEKEDFDLAKQTIGKYWKYVEQALDTKDGGIYSRDSFDVDFSRIP